METEAGCCAVHALTMEKIDTVTKDLKDISGKVNDMGTKVATVIERLDNTKALVWLVVVNLIAGVIGIIIAAVK